MSLITNSKDKRKSRSLIDRLEEFVKKSSPNEKLKIPTTASCGDLDPVGALKIKRLKFKDKPH